MPRTRTKRFYYRNGRVHTEIRQKDGSPHGLCRTWHFNGRLAEELQYRNGLMDGVSRQWDERGRLLGFFKMTRGTGRQQYWHENGLLKLEIDSLNGQFHGRTRVWLRDGTLTEEKFYIQNASVSRAAYLKRARKNPGWPQYEGEREGCVARKTSALNHKEHELFVESILEKSHAEAVTWLTSGRPGPSLPKFRSCKTALRFVNELYSVGAVSVMAVPIYAGPRKQSFADWLLIQLPGKPAQRRAIRKICQDFCVRKGGAMLPEKEMGEAHLFMRLA